MLTLALIAQKGGVGKSTLSVNLAIQAWARGIPTALLDADPQATVSSWHRRREASGLEGPLVAHVSESKDVQPAREAAQADGAQLLVVDTPAGVSRLSEEAAAVADLCLLPCVPSVFDMDAMASTVLLLSEYPQKPAYFILNRCGRSQQQNMSAAEALASNFGYTAVPYFITMRTGIADAGLEGRAFVELDSRDPSTVRGQREFEQLGQWLDHQLKRGEAA